jgi:hypothetical protein
VLAPAAAGSVLELSGGVHVLGCLCFSFFGKLFVFALISRQALICCLPDISVLTAMAQMKPNSSRPTAVMIFLCSFPAADSLT